MRIEQPTLQGRFLRRYKRFFADVELEDGSVITAHCPNTGSLRGCLKEGSPAILRDSRNPKRKLRYGLQTLKVGRAWVNVDTGLPNAVVAEAIESGDVAELRGYAQLQREVPYGDKSRIDILLSDATGRQCFVEVKSTTLARQRVARFPDAVTDRGRKHLEELARVVNDGQRAVQFFFISRADVGEFRPADDIDPAYGAALRGAVAQGVEVLAYKARVRPRELAVAQRIPVHLD